jgi:hypothetical protein
MTDFLIHIIQFFFDIHLPEITGIIKCFTSIEVAPEGIYRGLDSQSRLEFKKIRAFGYAQTFALPDELVIIVYGFPTTGGEEIYFAYDIPDRDLIPTGPLQIGDLCWVDSLGTYQRWDGLSWTTLDLTNAAPVQTQDITRADLTTLISTSAITGSNVQYRITDAGAGVIRVYGIAANEIDTLAFLEGSWDGTTWVAGQVGTYNLATDTFTAITGSGGSAYKGQISRTTTGTINIATAGTFQTTGLTATLDTSTANGIALGTTDTFAVKNVSGETVDFLIIAEAQIDDGNNKVMGIVLVKNGTPITETIATSATGSATNFAKMVSAWIVTMDDGDEVAMWVTNYTNTGNVTLLRGRIVATTSGAASSGGGGVQSVTGNIVDNTDPANPIVDAAVSTDIGNDLTLGSDGLPYYNDPGGSGLSLETDGTPNGDQTLLNLVSGTNITLTDDGLGNVTIDASGGDVVGPSSSVNNNIALFDGTTGKLIKDSGILLSAKLDVAAGANYRLTVSDGSGDRGNASAITAAHALKSDANGIPTHFDTATEPSLTELTYVKGVTSAIQTQIDSKLGKDVTIDNKTANYTLVLTDANKMIEMTDSSNRTITVPLDATVAFPIGTSILVARNGTGEVAIAGAVGVTLIASGNRLRLYNQYSIATLIKRGTDEWYLSGDIKV